MKTAKLLLLAMVASLPLFSSPKPKQLTEFEFRKISTFPEVYECDNFLTDAECDKLIEKARPLLTRSTVINSATPGSIVDSRRTSFGMFFPQNNEHTIIRKIRNRIARITGLPAENGEGIQVLQYAIGAEYRPHFDFFDPKTPGGLAHFNRGGQRVATVLFYLNTVPEGGETIFPEANLAIAPKKRKAVLFYNVRPDGKVDPKSLHGGAPVLAGEKWIATLWLREGRFN